MREVQLGRSQDPRTAAAPAFAHELVENRGQVRDEDVEALRAAGFDDEEVVEVVAHVALNLSTDYLDVGLDVPLDFPAVRLSAAR